MLALRLHVAGAGAWPVILFRGADSEVLPHRAVRCARLGGTPGRGHRERDPEHQRDLDEAAQAAPALSVEEVGRWLSPAWPPMRRPSGTTWST